MTLDRLLAAADQTQDELLALWQRIVQFETVNTGIPPTGHETPCAEYLREQLAADGIAAEVWEAAPERGNLLATLPGTSGGRSLLWMSHLDVVPPGDVARWSAPPFSGTVRDGWLLGRGSNDCKGLTAAEVHALRLLARLGVRLAGDLKLACCADEETGGKYGFEAVAAQRPEALRADLAINEGGGSPTRLPDGRPAYYVANGEKGRFEARLRSSAAASTPRCRGWPTVRCRGSPKCWGGWRPGSPRSCSPRRSNGSSARYAPARSATPASWNGCWPTNCATALATPPGCVACPA